jgi:transcriptional regulator GlxA family with amidase domain
MTDPIRVSLAVTGDTQLAPLSGLYETLTAFPLLARLAPDVPARPFDVTIVTEGTDPPASTGGLPHRPCAEVLSTDIAVVPLMVFDGPDWVPGRSPALVDWLRWMHARGATLCSTCTGVLLLAETGLLDGGEATIHWAFAPAFRRCHPDVRLRLDEVLVLGGARSEFVMTGGVASWHDLALHLIKRHVGPAAASGMARLMMLEWHGEGQAPFRGFLPPRDHGDRVILRAQDWAGQHYMAESPVEEMAARTGLARRSFDRRFARATGRSPIAYVQALRVDAAKRRLERSDAPVEEIAAAVGYENTSYFRRLFKRTTRMTPAGYRHRFRIPSAGARPSPSA